MFGFRLGFKKQPPASANFSCAARSKRNTCVSTCNASHKNMRVSTPANVLVGILHEPGGVYPQGIPGVSRDAARGYHGDGTDQSERSSSGGGGRRAHLRVAGPRYARHGHVMRDVTSDVSLVFLRPGFHTGPCVLCDCFHKWMHGQFTLEFGCSESNANYVRSTLHCL